MRLTVRTLLAYLDHVLPEEANEALSAKLRDSPYATQLAEKIKASIQRSDLGSPAVGAVHPIENANTIAEYLDSVLQAEQIPEVERVLLESDVHMSEAAACHQILTLVLSRPALVPHGLRDRIYQMSQGAATAAGDAASGGAHDPSLAAPSVASLDLPATGAPAQDSGSHAIDTAPTVAAPFRSAVAATGGQPKPNGHAAGLSPRKPDVPEYLRAGRPARILPWLMTLGLCAVLLFIIAKAFQPVSRLASDSPKVHSVDDPLDVQRENMPAPNFGPAGETPGEVVVKDAEKTKPAAATTSSGVSATAIPQSTPPETGVTTTGTQPTAAPAVAPDPVNPDVNKPGMTNALATPGAPAADPAAAVAAAAAVADPATPAVAAPAIPATEPGTEPMPAVPATEPAVPADAASGSPAPQPVDTAAMDPAVAPMPTTEPPPAVDATPAGTLDSSDTILLNRVATGWQRVTKEAPVVAGTALVNLPTFRSRILLADGVGITSVGEAEFSFEPGENAALTTTLNYGRFILETSTPDATIELNLRGRQAMVHLPTVDSRAAIHVTTFRAPGADPTLATSIQPIVAVHVLGGSVGWTMESSKEVPLGARVRWSQVGTAAATTDLPDPPAWTVTPEANAVSIESLSRKGLLELIDDTKTIEISLREAVGFRRAEVAALAARSLLTLGVPDIYFGAKGIFESETQKSHWQEHFAAMQSHLDRGGQHAIGLRDAIARMNAAQATSQYRLLWGYSPEQLAGGADFALIEALNDAALTTRVLALENLRQITGTTLSYRPQETGPRRAAAAKKWDTKLAAKDLQWEQVPTPLSALER